MKFRLGVVLLLAATLVGCAGEPRASVQPTASPQPTASSEPAPTTSPSPTGRPSPAEASDPPGEDDLLVSEVYPYSLRWPAAERRSEWRVATTAWDGQARVDNGNKYTDWVATTQGNLFAFGTSTGGSAAEFDSLTAANASEWHGCDEDATASEQLDVSGAEGIFAEYQCGTSQVFRWLAVHDGFGLAVILLVAPAVDAAQARADLIAAVEQIVWRE